MRVTHILSQADIVNGPGLAKLLEAQIEHTNRSQAWEPLKVTLDFVIEDDFGTKHKVSVRMHDRMEWLQYWVTSRKSVPGVRFAAEMGDDLIEITYYLANPDKERGQFRDLPEETA